MAKPAPLFWIVRDDGAHRTIFLQVASDDVISRKLDISRGDAVALARELEGAAAGNSR